MREKVDFIIQDLALRLLFYFYLVNIFKQFHDFGGAVMRTRFFLVHHSLIYPRLSVYLCNLPFVRVLGTLSTS